jgi:ABC-type amino acid transport substrate-binding protein
MKKTKWLFSMIALLALVVAGCGGETVGEGKQGANQLDKIKSAGVIRIAIEGAYPPYNFFNDKNQLDGFDVDVSNEVAKRLGVKPELIATPWDSMVSSLLADKFDVIISSMAITEERKQKVDFAGPYFYTGQVLFAPNDTSIADPNDIKGRKIGAQIAANAIDVATKLEAEVVPYKTDYLGFQDMSIGRIEGVITDKGVGASITKEKNYPVKIVGDVLLEESAGMTINKGQDSLRNELNKIIDELRTEGTLEEISMKWYGQDITKK